MDLQEFNKNQSAFADKNVTIVAKYVGFPASGTKFGCTTPLKFADDQGYVIDVCSNRIFDSDKYYTLKGTIKFGSEDFMGKTYSGYILQLK